jgi:acetylornithine deacetylase/succinyl-diaminopimelate desuccinylase-like protein
MSDRAHARAILFEVLAIDSTWGRERALAEHLADRFAGWGLQDVQLVDVPGAPGRPSVIGRLPGRGAGRSLVLNGHMDIYEVSADWTLDPFTPVERNGRVYGAGIADMKSGLAAMCAAMEALARSPDRLAGDVWIQAVSAHFEGGLGTRAALAAGARADAAVFGEPSALRIGVAQCGAVYLDITTRGKQAHTTAKHLGINAIERMVPVIGAVNRLEETLPYQPHPLLPGGPIVNIGTIHGGTKHNQVPDRCTISVDIRLLPSQDAAAVRAFVQRVVDEWGAEVAYSPYWLSGPRVPCQTPADAAIVRAAQDVVAGVPQGAQQLVGLPFWTDMPAAAALGIPGIDIGPGGPPYNWADEWVALDEYLAAVAVYEQLARAWCRR